MRALWTLARGALAAVACGAACVATTLLLCAVLGKRRRTLVWIAMRRALRRASAPRHRPDAPPAASEDVDEEEAPHDKQA